MSAVNNLSRDYESIKKDLISYSEKYYPEITTNFQDGSVGSWFVDLIASVGDALNYAIDRNIQETQTKLSSKESALNNAMMNGVKIPGAKAASCEVEFSCVLPAAQSENLGSPEWDYAPIIKRGAIVSAGGYSFEVQEDIDFSKQFNDNGFSNRKFKPNRDSNGLIDGYTVYKTAIAMGGITKIYKKVLSSSEIEPFMEIILPDKGALNVESIIFKESSNFSTTPDIHEFYINKETFQNTNEAVLTHRYFEVDSLADQYVFVNDDDVNELDGKAVSTVEDYVVDGQELRRIYKGKWLTVRNKFITEFTSNNYLKIIFGSSNKASTIPENQTVYADYFMSNIINNDFLGVLPDANWTMYVLYRVNGGKETNIAPNSINTISHMTCSIPNITSTDSSAKKQEKNNALSSIKVTNLSQSLGGKDFPSVKEIKYLTKYNVNAQGRCVTLKDYKARIMSIPPRYGCPFRLNVMEENNKISIPMLGITSEGKLTEEISNLMCENIKEYLENYKMLTDFIELRSGNVFHLSFTIQLYIDKNYDTNTVALNVINTVKNYMDINNRDMGEDVFIGDLEKEITMLDGVINIIDFQVFYKGTEAPPLPLWKPDACSDADADGNENRIDIEALDGILTCPYDAMYEIEEPDKDIKLNIKLR